MSAVRFLGGAICTGVFRVVYNSILMHGNKTFDDLVRDTFQSFMVSHGPT